MEQLSFIDTEHESRKRSPKREQFLPQMEDIIPWTDWCALIEPYYPKAGNGRPPRELEQMLRTYLLQVGFNLSDESTEDAIYDSYAMKRFLRLNFTNESVPDATTLGNFRHLSDISEAHNLIREDDKVVYGDSGYLGLEKRKEIKEDEQLSQIECRICRRPSQSRITSNYTGENWNKTIEHQKSSVRCKVEHPFLIVKRQFGYCKTVYRGRTKNLARFFMLFASANLCMCLRAGRQKDFCAA